MCWFYGWSVCVEEVCVLFVSLFYFVAIKFEYAILVAMNNCVFLTIIVITIIEGSTEID
jgi:hypothetical protein